MDKTYQHPLSGSEIARELGITRQAVSFALRKSVVKMYHEILNRGYAEGSFEAIQTLAEMLQVNLGSIEDIRDFISLFPEDIQEEIKTDARLLYNIRG